MATNLGNRVTYRSPDALQNLRLKVTLTRISGPRMDRAREMDARFGSGPNPQAQIQAAQQQAAAYEEQRFALDLAAKEKGMLESRAMLGRRHRTASSAAPTTDAPSDQRPT